ncbi:MAG: hypothetical protein AAF533_01715 [Acidobacteriota bacterium]
MRGQGQSKLVLGTARRDTWRCTTTLWRTHDGGFGARVRARGRHRSRGRSCSSAFHADLDSLARELERIVPSVCAGLPFGLLDESVIAAYERATRLVNDLEPSELDTTTPSGNSRTSGGTASRTKGGQRKNKGRRKVRASQPASFD